MKISIITASYNYADYIGQGIESVINQTYTDWELIIVDDGSKDNSVEVIKNYVNQHSNIFLYQHENGINKGLKDTLLLGLSKATGDYIAFLESDDYWSENHLQEKINVIEKHPDVKFIYNAVELFGDEASIKELLRNTADNPPVEEKQDEYAYIPLSFLKMNVASTFSSMMIEKNVLLECDFNVAYPPYLDLWLTHQIAIKYKLYYLNQKLTYWRIHPNSYSNDRKNNKNSKKIQNHFRKHYESYIKNLLYLKYNIGTKLAVLILFIIKWLTVPNKINKIFRGSINKLEDFILKKVVTNFNEVS